MDIYHPVKTCFKCGIEKSITEFNKNKKKKDGLNHICKCCVRDYYQKNKDSIKERGKEYYQKNKDKRKQYNKLYQEQNKERIYQQIKNWNKNNTDKIKEYREQNKEYINNRQKVYCRKRRDNDPIYKLNGNIRTLVRKSIKKKGFKKNTKTEQILGCSLDSFKSHLESQFDENMNWNNHGKYWDIDHIIPVSSAVSEDDIIRLNHYTNLRPLERNYNRYVKGSKIT